MNEEKKTVNGRVVAIVLAAGQGKRMHSDVAKQFLPLCGRPVICYSLDVFEKSDYIDEIILVTGEDSIGYCQREIVRKFGYRKISNVIAGGKERYHSVWNGLNGLVHIAVESPEAQAMQIEGISMMEKPDYVLIHDGARPFISDEIIQRNLEALVTEQACVTGMPSKDTVKIADENGYVADTPARSRVWNIQTPQSFAFPVVFEAYRQLIVKEAEVLAEGIFVTDDAMVVEHFANVPVKLVEGSYENIKITTPEDLLIAENLVKK